MSIKPWLETWEAVHEGGISQVGCDGVVIIDIDERGGRRELDFGYRASLIAAAPALVRALLLAEVGEHICPCPEGNMDLDPMCGVCSAYMRGKKCELGAHDPECELDAALDAAGLDTTAKRDEARAEMTKEPA